MAGAESARSERTVVDLFGFRIIIDPAANPRMIYFHTDAGIFMIDSKTGRVVGTLSFQAPAAAPSTDS